MKKTAGNGNSPCPAPENTCRERQKNDPMSIPLHEEPKASVNEKNTGPAEYPDRNRRRQTDEQISGLIARMRAEDYDAFLSGTDRWELFAPLSSLRRSLLDWYDFGEDPVILEIGSGFGALTGVLLDRAAQVDALEADPLRADGLAVRYSSRSNLNIIQKPLADFVPERQYDFIVFSGFPESAAAGPAGLLIRLKGMLAEDGRLLFTFRNRDGYPYLAGAADEYVRSPGANRFSPFLYTKAEISAALEQAGYPAVKWYYPLPAAPVVQAVYTDSRLPKTSVRDRVLCFDALSETLSADPRDVLEQVIENGTLPEHAADYLVEAGRTVSKIEYASTSTDRGKEHGFATLLYEDKTAVKKALWKEGEAALSASFTNGKKLEERGLSVVPAEFRDGRIFMKKEEGPTAAELVRTEIGTDPSAFQSLLDQYWQDICASSETIALSDRDAEREWGVTAAELGPVLKEAFIDMIPYNSFYRDGRLRYFDQEFVRRDCPAGYVMFRVLHYLWQYAPETKKTLSPEMLKHRYGLTAMWNRYEESEALFTWQNRNCALYASFFRWTDTSPSAVRERAEKRSGPEDPEEEKQRKIRALRLDLLKQVDQICGRHGLVYTAIFGTLLGAVRHGGFIPWDEDIDLAMPREDYDRFVKIAWEELKEPYFLQTPASDPKCFYGGYARLRNSNTTAVEPRHAANGGNQGIWIEIYPLDHCGEDLADRNRQQRKVFFAQRMLYAKVYPFWTGALADSDPKKISLYYILAERMSHARLCKRLYRTLTAHKKTGWRTVFATYYAWKKNWSLVRDEDLQHLKRVPFENTTIPVPESYDEWLIRRYGKNYAQFPPPENRQNRSGVRYDPDHSYRQT